MSAMGAELESGFLWANAELTSAHDYLLPAVLRTLSASDRQPGRHRVLDLGCGNGSVTAELAARGWDILGVEPSESGLAQARARHPQLRFEQGSAYEPLAERFGCFDVVLSLEVIEHLYDPRAFARQVRALLSPGGTALISTPYHGYLKNLALALTGTMDAHFTVLWDHGHIKFFSPRTLTTLLQEAGLRVGEIQRLGRIPPLAKSMLAVCKAT